MAGKIRAMRDALLENIRDEMYERDDIFFLSGDFGSPVLDDIRTGIPKQFINVGIAEQNLINVAAGLALEGYTVFAYAIAPFITMRCYEQIRVNLALLSVVREMNVNLIGVGAGYSYPLSGPTHQCYEDISIMRTLPTLRVYSPSDWQVAAGLSSRCLENSGIKYLRLDAQPLPALVNNQDSSHGFIERHKGDCLCILSTGYMTHTAEQVVAHFMTRHLSIGLLDMVDLSEPDKSRLTEILKSYDTIITIEEGFVGKGGLDAMIFDLKANSSLDCRVINMGLDNHYHFALGEREALHRNVGIDIDSVIEKVDSLS